MQKEGLCMDYVPLIQIQTIFPLYEGKPRRSASDVAGQGAGTYRNGTTKRN